jgi:hypothetical protein
MTKEFVLANKAGFQFAGRMLGAATAGIAIGCAAGKLNEF